jgi:hypothetical protein
MNTKKILGELETLLKQQQIDYIEYVRRALEAGVTIEEIREEETKHEDFLLREKARQIALSPIAITANPIIQRGQWDTPHANPRDGTERKALAKYYKKQLLDLNLSAEQEAEIEEEIKVEHEKWLKEELKRQRKAKKLQMDHNKPEKRFLRYINGIHNEIYYTEVVRAIHDMTDSQLEDFYNKLNGANGKLSISNDITRFRAIQLLEQAIEARSKPNEEPHNPKEPAKLLHHLLHSINKAE